MQPYFHIMSTAPSQTILTFNILIIASLHLHSASRLVQERSTSPGMRTFHARPTNRPLNLFSNPAPSSLTKTRPTQPSKHTTT